MLGAVAAAQEASVGAGALWAQAAARLREALTVREAYRSAPDAGTRAHLLAE